MLSLTPALAQEAPPPTTNTPAADAVGPRELQNFSLNGTVTQRSDQPAQAPAATRPPRNQAQSNSAVASPDRTAAPESRATQTASSRASAQIQPKAEPPRQTASSASVPTSVPAVDPNSGSSAPLTTAASAAPAFAPEPASLDLAPEHKFPLMPWLLAALALAAGVGFLFWRNRSRHAFAGGPQVDAFVAPEPTPAPRPAPEPPKAKSPPAPPSPPSSSGIVSTRLRPWIEIGFNPVRCILDDEKLTI